MSRSASAKIPGVIPSGMFALVLLIGMVAGCDSAEADFATVEYLVGQNHTFNVRLGSGMLCSGDTDLRTGRVVAVSERAVFLSDLDNPAGGYTDEHFESLAAKFDAQLWPLLTKNFGQPHDVDRNQRVVVLFTRAVNELTPRGAGQYVGGVFSARDLFPGVDSRRLGGCAGSNEAEMIYMIVPDPGGAINGNVRTVANEYHRAPKVLVHEMQHLINASRRLYDGNSVSSDWNEAVWLNEGLSHVAEELSGYATGGLAPRSNLGPEAITSTPGAEAALSQYQYPNFQNLARHLDDPESSSPFGSDGLATRGAIWQFLRYAADRRGGGEDAFWRSFIRPDRSGFDNLQASLGADPLEWMQDWLISNYTDDFIQEVHSRYELPSWNLRELFPYLRSPSGKSYGRYPLRTHVLAEGAPVSIDLVPGGSAYLEFSTRSNLRAEIRTSQGGASCLTGGPSRSLSVGDVWHVPEPEINTFCLDVDVAGAAFVMIPFNGSTTASLHLSITGDGLGPQDATKSAWPQQQDLEEASAFAWEAEFREQERQELSRLIHGTPDASTASRALETTSSSSDLRMAVVRTR